MGKKSIVQKDESRCFLCGRTTGLERHHILGGPNRKLSEQYGLTCMLCGINHHREGPESAHKNRQVSDSLKRLAQIAFEARYGHDEWMETFRKNYL